MMSAAPTLTLNASQSAALNALKTFLKSDDAVFILNGSAGTGKTTLVKSVCDDLKSKKIPFALTASTGRAAKVLSAKAGHIATTLHRLLYLFDEVNGNAGDDEDPWASDTGQLFLSFGLRTAPEDERPEVIIVDEASMVSHLPADDGHTARFGSGNLLADLLHFAGEAKLIFVGDNCQLPPVADTAFSATLSTDYWQQAGRQARMFTLTEIVRQEADNEILQVAGRFRKAIQTPQPGTSQLWKLPLPQRKNFFAAAGKDDFFRQYYEAVQTHGLEQAIAICHSNEQAHILNKMMRQKLHGKEALQPGDLLMVVQNSYNTSLVNGDQVVVEAIQAAETRAGFHFQQVKVKSLFGDETHDTLLITDLLYTTEAGLSPDHVKRLIIDFDTRMKNAGVKRNSPTYKDKLKTDPWVNALRAKFGYALTVHKAQGGEWNAVFLYLNNSIYAPVYDRKSPVGRHPEGPEKYHRWFYTAVTRARQSLTVNDSLFVQDFEKRQPKETAKHWRDVQTKKALAGAAEAREPICGKVTQILNQNERGVNGFLKGEGISAKIYFTLDAKNPVAAQLKAGTAVSFEVMPAKGEKGPKATRIKILK